MVDGKKTPIYTKISHGEREIRDKLLGVMARQLRLTRLQFLELIDCKLTEPEYVQLLRGASVLAGARPDERPQQGAQPVARNPA
jgi:hypothetical protein